MISLMEIGCRHPGCDNENANLYVPVLTCPYAERGKRGKMTIELEDYVVCAQHAMEMKPLKVMPMDDWELFVNKLLRDGLDVPDRSRARLIFKPIDHSSVERQESPEEEEPTP